MEEKILRVGVDTADASPQLNTLAREFKGAGDGAKGMEANISKANTQLDKTDNKAKGASSAVDKLGKSVQSTQSPLESMHRGLGGIERLLAGLGAGFTFAHIIKETKEFEEALLSIRGLVGATADQVAKYKERVLELGSVTGRGPNELAKGLYFVTSAGFSGAEALDVLEQSAKAAASGLGETKVVADAVTSAVNAYGHANLSAEAAVGVLVAAVREGKAEASDMAVAIGRVLPLSSQLGVSFQEVGAAMASMTRLGLDAHESVTALVGIFNTLMDPGAEAEQVLNKFGTSSEQLRQVLKEKGLLELLLQLKETIGGNEQAFADVFPNVRALVGVLNLVGKNVGAAKEIFAKLNTEMGQSARTAFKDTEGAGRDMDRAMADMNKTLIELGEHWLPLVAGALKVISGLMNGIVERTKSAAEGIAAITIGSDEVVQRMEARVEKLKTLIDETQAARNGQFRLSRLSDIAGEHLLSNTQLEAMKREVAGLERSIAQALKKEHDEFLDEMIKDIGDKPVEAEVKKLQDKLKTAFALQQSSPILFWLFGYKQSDVERETKKLAALVNGEFEKERAKRQEASLLEEVTKPRRSSRQVLDDTFNTQAGAKKLGGVVTFDDKDKEALQNMKDSFNSFDSQVEQTRKGVDLLFKAIKTGNSTSKEMSAVVAGMTKDLAELAFKTNDFNAAIENSDKLIALMAEQQKKGVLSTQAQSQAYDQMAVSMAEAATRTNNFKEATENVGTATGKLAEWLRAGKVSSDDASAAFKEMSDKLMDMIGSAGNAADAAKRLDEVNRILMQGMNSGLISIDSVKGSMTDLVEQLARAAVSTQDYGLAFSNARIMVEAMKKAVDSGNLSQEAARAIYEQMVETLKKLNPEMEKAKKTQENWKKLVDASGDPLAQYNERMRELTQLARDLTAAGMDQAKVQELLAKAQTQAAREYDEAMAKLDPRTKKWQAAIERVGDASAEAFSNMIQGANSFKDVLNGLLRSIQDVIIQLLILEPLKQGITQGLGSILGIPTTGGTPTGPPTGNVPVSGVQVAAGGTPSMKRGLYLVGEEGPELVMSRGGASVFSSLKTKQMLSSDEKRTAASTPRQSIVVQMPQISDPKPRESGTQVNVHNYGSEKTDVQRRRDGSGTEIVDVIVGTVTRNINERGSVDKAMRGSGRLIRR